MNIRNNIAYQVFRRIEDTLKNENVLDCLKFLHEAQWWSEEQIREFQLHKLEILLNHAYENTVYYKECFKEMGLKPSDIRTIDDLKKLPILSRDNLRNNWDKKLRAGNINYHKCLKGSSSGSSGNPVTYFKDTSSISSGRAAQFLFWEACGWSLGERTGILWGNYKTAQHEWTRLSSRIKAILYRELRLPAYQLINQQKILETLQKISNKYIKFLFGYTNAIFTIALAAAELKTPLNHIKAVFTTAETINEKTRNTIEKFIGPVYDGYGSGEVLGVAFQCEKKELYHIVEPNVIVEYKDIGLENQKSLIITDLTNFATPLIRYEIGDIGIESREKCPCGRNWKALTGIVGRTNDILTTPSGGNILIPSGFGSSLLKEIDGISRYQLAQIKDDQVVLRVELDTFIDRESIIQNIEKIVDTYLSGFINYSIEIVERIPFSQCGKYKILIDERDK